MATLPTAIGQQQWKLPPGVTSGQPGMQPQQGLTVSQGLGAPTMAPQTGVTSTNYGLPPGMIGVQGTGVQGTAGVAAHFGNRPTSALQTQPQQGASTFSQGSNLINAQFSPNASSRLANFRNTADTAAQNYAGLGSEQNIGALRQGFQTGLTSAQGASPFQYKPGSLQSIMQGMGMPGAPGLGAEAQKLRGFVMDDLGKVREGADRGKLAADAFDLMVQRSQPGREQQVRQLGQKTAALGRIGSGIYGSDLTDLQGKFDREDSLSRQELANQAAQQQLADRMGILDATRGVSGDVSSQDARVNAGYAGAMGDAYQRAKDERDFQFDVQRYNNDLAFRRGGFEQDTARGVFGSEGEYDDRRFSQSRSRAGDLSGYARDIEDSERADRGELRGERGYQYGLERDAQDDRYRRRGFEEDLVDRSFDRDIRQRTVEDALFGNQFDRSRQLYGMGSESGLPQAYSWQANRYDRRAENAGDAIGDLVASYGLRKQQKAPTSPSEDFYRATGVYPVDALPGLKPVQPRMTPDGYWGGR